MKKMVMEVLRIEAELWPGEALAWRIRAIGVVPTSGWTEAQLVPSASPPSDGAVHLDFVAKPPGGIANPVLTGIDASTSLPIRPDAARLVVHARTNALTRTLPGDGEHWRTGGDGPSPFFAPTKAGGGGDMPTPFKVIVEGGGGDSPTPFKVIVEGGGGDMPTPFRRLLLDSHGGLARPVISAAWMVGMKLRVVHPGDVVTADFDDERVNVHVDDAERIVRVTIG